MLNEVPKAMNIKHNDCTADTKRVMSIEL